MSDLTYSVLELPLDEITANPANDYSMDATELKQLADSIEHDGLGQPPLVRKLDDGSYQMIAGHRRLAAYKILRNSYPGRYTTIPVNVVENITDAQANVLLHVTNLVSRSMSEEERAEKLMELNKLVPELRKQDDRWRGVRTRDVIATILTEQTGEEISGPTVQRILTKEKKRREAAQQAVELGKSAQANWKAEADAGHIGPRVMQRISEYPEEKQREIYIQWQRSGGSQRTLSRLLHNADLPDAQTMARLCTRAEEALKDLNAAIKKGGVPNRFTLSHLEEEMATLRQRLQGPTQESEEDKAISELLEAGKSDKAEFEEDSLI